MTESRDGGNARRGGSGGHEVDRLSLTAVGICLLALLLLIVGVQPIVAWLMAAYGGVADPTGAVKEFEPGSARHWNDPEGDLAALRAEEERHLSEYAWVDRDEGVVRIPITRAMELFAEKEGSRARLDSAADGVEGAGRSPDDEDEQR